MEKPKNEGRALVDRVLAAYGWNREQLADKVGKAKRTIDAVMRAEIPLSKDLEAHLQTLLEHAPAVGATAPRASVVSEGSGNYDPVKKVINLLETASPEQRRMLDIFLASLAEMGLSSEKEKRPRSEDKGK